MKSQLPAPVTMPGACLHGLQSLESCVKINFFYVLLCYIDCFLLLELRPTTFKKEVNIMFKLSEVSGYDHLSLVLCTYAYTALWGRNSGRKLLVSQNKEKGIGVARGLLSLPRANRHAHKFPQRFHILLFLLMAPC